MKKINLSLLIIFLVGIIGISLAGCAGGPTATTATAPAKPTPQLLSEAGFKASSGNTSKQIAYMQNCPKDTLMIHTRADTNAYCYVDQATNTMYMGDEAAYQRLQNLLKSQQQTIREKKIENDPLFWDMWQSSRGIGG